MLDFQNKKVEPQARLYCLAHKGKHRKNPQE